MKNECQGVVCSGRLGGLGCKESQVGLSTCANKATTRIFKHQMKRNATHNQIRIDFNHKSEQHSVVKLNMSSVMKNVVLGQHTNRQTQHDNKQLFFTFVMRRPPSHEIPARRRGDAAETITRDTGETLAGRQRDHHTRYRRDAGGAPARPSHEIPARRWRGASETITRDTGGTLATTHPPCTASPDSLPPPLPQLARSLPAPSPKRSPNKIAALSTLPIASCVANRNIVHNCQLLPLLAMPI